VTVLSGGSNALLSFNTVNYVAAGSYGLSSTEANVAAPFPVAGTIGGLQIRLAGGSPGTGNNYVFNVMKNGLAVSGFTCTIADSATTCTDTDTLSMAAGDTLSLRTTPTSNPTQRAVTWSVTLG
jgi:hypothetical protein